MADRPVALITGAARRIGRAIAEDLAAHGFDVVVHANTSIEAAHALADALQKDHNINAYAVEGDLTDSAQARSVVQQASAQAGPLSILVNNASLFEPDTLEEPDAEAWARHFSVHVQTPSVTVAEFAKQRHANMEGLVVNLIDQRVWRLTPNFYSYTLSKSALWTATQTMAQALAPHIRVNAIGPGPTLANARQDPADFAKQVKAVPLQRGADLAEFGMTVRYLWEARSVTGQMIALDGGQHLAWETPDVAGIRE